MWQPGWEGSLEENGYMDMYGWPLHCSPKTITILLISYTPIKSLKEKKDTEKKKELPLMKKGDDRGIEGCMASPTRWTWVWESSGSWWWMVREAWQTAVHGITKSQTQLTDWTDWLTAQEFPGSPVTTTQHFYCKGPRFDPWLGNWILKATQCRQKRIKKSFQKKLLLFERHW